MMDAEPPKFTTSIQQVEQDEIVIEDHPISKQQFVGMSTTVEKPFNFLGIKFGSTKSHQTPQYMTVTEIVQKKKV